MQGSEQQQRSPGAGNAVPPSRPRRWPRLARWFGVVLLVYFLPVFVGCMSMATPFDYVINMGSFPHQPELVVPADGRRHIVFLKHGIFRSAGSLWKLERALRDHGYEVQNIGYDSTGTYIEDASSDMARQVRAYLGDSSLDTVRIYYVGHSMGGLVIRHYLTRADAVRPDRCVFIATPQRGAALTDERKDWWLFQTFLGDKAALQLSPGSSFYEQLREPHEGFEYGVIFGFKGDEDGWNDDVPGDDDGTVAVAETRLQGQTDAIGLHYGHTRLSFADRAMEQVLQFLKSGHFKQPKPASAK